MISYRASPPPIASKLPSCLQLNSYRTLSARKQTVDVTKAAAMYVNDLPHPKAGAFPLEAPLATHICCRPSDDSQCSSPAMQQVRVPQCSRLAAHCLHDTCYIVRARKNRQQLASAKHVHTSVNGSGSTQQFGIDSHSLWHGNWSGRSGYDLFCQRTTQNATHKYFLWLRCYVPLWNRQKAVSSSRVATLLSVVHVRTLP